MMSGLHSIRYFVLASIITLMYGANSFAEQVDDDPNAVYRYRYKISQLKDGCRGGKWRGFGHQENKEAELTQELIVLAQKLNKPLSGLSCQSLYEEEIEDARQAQLTLNSKAPEIIKEMDKLSFCATYGNAIRGESGVLLNGQPEDFVKHVKTEAKKRKIKFDDKLVGSKSFKIGSTECHLYAAWGFAQESNRTVGKWGEHIQYIYGDTYVYVENGKVTSYQD